MHTKLFMGSALGVVLAVATAAFAGVSTEAKPAITPEPVKIAQSGREGQPCCALDDCCLECILCCSIDGCCEDCVQCCIDMGCAPFCCFPALTSAKAEVPKKARGCCDDGCCK